MSFYNTIAQQAVAEYKDRGSKFLAYAYPFSDAKLLKALVQPLKNEHSKAVHYCFAYRLGVDGLAFRSSDDGEPANSAGKPILSQIDSKQITNVLVVVVRYFGGTLLGIPGLVNAYKTATSLVLQTIPIVQLPILKNYSLQYDYEQINKVNMIIKQYGCVIYAQQQLLFASMQIGIPMARVDEVLYLIKGLRNVEIV